MIKKIREWLRKAREAEQERIGTLQQVAGYKHAAGWILLWASMDERDDNMVDQLRAEMVDERVPARYRRGIQWAFDDYAKLAERKR